MESTSIRSAREPRQSSLRPQFPFASVKPAEQRHIASRTRSCLDCPRFLCVQIQSFPLAIAPAIPSTPMHRRTTATPVTQVPSELSQFLSIRPFISFNSRLRLFDVDTERLLYRFRPKGPWASPRGFYHIEVVNQEREGSAIVGAISITFRMDIKAIT